MQSMVRRKLDSEPSDQGQDDVEPEGWGLIGSLIKDGDALHSGRRRLLAGARECFARKGYGGTVVSEIASAAGVSIGSFYKYVRSKEDLLWLLAEDAHSRTQAAINEALLSCPDDAVSRLQATIDAFIRVTNDNIQTMETFHLEFKHMPDACKARVREYDGRLVDRFASIISDGVAEGRLQCEDAHFAAVAIEMMATEWVLKRSLLAMDLDSYIDAQQQFAVTLLGAAAPDPA
jgi:AcrR family transcriptional regulator